MAKKADKFVLTVSSIRTRCLPPEPGELNGKGKPVTQRIYWDSQIPGFGMIVGHTARTFFVQRDVKGKGTVRRVLDRYPTITIEQARDAAHEVLFKLRQGIDPKEEKRAKIEEQRRQEWQTYTLRQALANHVADMRKQKSSPRSIEMMEQELERHLGDWMNRPLVTLKRKDCKERHDKITESGPYVANRVMRMFRAVWNSASSLYEELPKHPLVKLKFNPEERRQEPIGWNPNANEADWNALADWWQKVRTLSNPIRRDLNLLMLFTGLRATDACTIRWEHVDFAGGTIYRPNPKGGKKKAFRVPLCRFILRLLARRRVQAGLYSPEGDGGWVFPTRNRAGVVMPIQEPKEQRFEVLEDGRYKKSFLLPSPHRLRDTFATACLEAHVGPTETKILMNHRLPKSDVTQGYQLPSTEHMRGCVEKVATFLRQKRREGQDRQLAEQKKAKGKAATTS